MGAGRAARRTGAEAWDAGGSGPGERDLVRTLAWALVYSAAAALGRMTVVGDAGVSLVSPAAGVSVLWLVARARPWPWVDVAALWLTSLLVLVLTGEGAASALLLATAVTLQAVLCVAVLERFAPHLWAGRGRVPLGRLSDLWWLLLGAGGAAVLSAPLAQVAVHVGAGGSTWDTPLLWFARNTVSVVTIVPLGWTFGAWLVGRRARGTLRQPSDRRTDGRAADRLVALVLAPVAYLLWFLQGTQPAVVFPLIGLTVWAGSRLPARWVVLHTTLCGGVVVQLTLMGSGPFAHLDDPVTQIGVAQLYVGLLAVIGLALALAGEERRQLVRELSTARDRAQEQAALLTAVVDTMSEGVRVVDASGRVVVRNPIAARLLAGTSHLDPADSTSDLVGLARPDGSPLREEELPFRRALAGHEVRDVDLLVRVPGQSEPRFVSFSATPIPAESGGGVVTVLRDVTLHRTELRRAAQVQASLLPARRLEVPGFDLAARFVPAGSVGGDFYDWQRLPGGLVLTMADVMGKGPAAAILAATTRSVLHAHSDPQDVAGTLTATEQAMDVDLVNTGAFVTVFHAFVDVRDGEVAYTDAGHGLSLVVRADGGVERLAATGLPLGVAPGPERVEARTRLRPGDLLLTFSDGVLDALGGSVADLDQVPRAVRGATTADAAAEAVLALVGDTGHAEDDLTVLALRRTAPVGAPVVPSPSSWDVTTRSA
ncbi:SpoIIE family protein phosphatase [Cellulomonas sp. JZ18]|uniref:SpoIIE family protein phosphatase n=1 Tax=Cellulomonas sp. JZ18 TaxID=2654191 RepID=UPI0012D49A46|nr:SpoIIE family protein phosphatase [Cellulomonas sp. JZ18]QGQ18967.1 SpoIIE family protein phosphatase [Cellulomonas sp. JZ18]